MSPILAIFLGVISQMFLTSFQSSSCDSLRALTSSVAFFQAAVHKVENELHGRASKGLDDNVAGLDELDDSAAPGTDSDPDYTETTCKHRRFFINASKCNLWPQTFIR